MAGRCLFSTMRLPVLFVAALASGGWALSESRPVRHGPLPALHLPLDEPTSMPSPPVERHPRVAPPSSRPSLPPPPRNEPPPLPRVASVSGRVVDDRGRPVPAAKVHLDHGGTFVTVDLDDDGRFKVSLAPGDYDVAAFDDNHDSAATSVELQEGETKEQLLLVLPTPAADEESGELRLRQEAQEDD